MFSNWFWWDKFFSNSMKLLSHYLPISIFCWTAFLYLQTFFINSIFLSFELFEPCSCSLESSVTFHLVLEFLFFVLFRILWMLATVNEAKFSLRKTLATLVKSLPCLGVNVGYPLLRLSLHHEKHWQHLMLTFMCSLTSAIIILFKAHDILHISDCSKYLSNAKTNPNSISKWDRVINLIGFYDCSLNDSEMVKLGKDKRFMKIDKGI